MGHSTPVICNVQAYEYGKVIIETSDRRRYYSDLGSFVKVLCFPQDNESWRQVSIDGYGLGLIWASRFEVHLDQVIGLAFKIEDTGSVAV